MLRNIQNFGLTKVKIFVFFCVSLLAAIFEGFSMALFLPLLEYIEKGRDVTVLATDSKLWQAIIKVTNIIGVEISLTFLLSVVFGLILMRVVTTYIRQIYSLWLIQDFRHHARTNIFSSFIKARYALFDKISTGHVVNLATTETDRAAACFNSFLAIITLAIVIAAYLLVLIWLSFPLTLFALFFLGIAGSIVVYFVRNTKKISYSSVDANKDFSALVVERLMAFRQIKISTACEAETEKIRQASREVSRHIYLLGSLNARVDVLLEPVVVSGGMVVLFFAVSYFHMALAQVGLFMLILLRLLPLSKEFLRSRQSFFSLIGSFKAVSGGINDAKAVGEVSTGTRKISSLQKGILFEGVTFHFGDAEIPTIKNVSINIPAGKMTAFVGPSGAGKSTLVDMIPQLRKPQKGTISIDGLPIENYDLFALRRAISFVSQDPFIFNDSVRSNIVSGLASVSDEDVWMALNMAKAHEFVKEFPDGLDSVLGERGVMLSGGQKQRIGLARALLKRTPILILDEPTSALDSESEMSIQSSISNLRDRQDITIIVIAHRLSTIRMADKIIVLQDGMVSQEGFHEELVISESWYSKVHNLQASA